MGTKALNELSDEQMNVIITVSRGTDVLTFASKTVELVEDKMLIEAVRHNEKVLSFNSKGVVVSAQIDSDPLPVKFIDIVIDTIRYKDEIYHRINTNKKGIEVNRRDNFRVFIGEEGVAQMDEHKSGRDVLVKDVSLTGFSIITRDDLDVIGAQIRLSYRDNNSTIVLSGEVVRKAGLEDGRFLYGCKITKEPIGLSSYLNRKQIKRTNMRGKNN